MFSVSKPAAYLAPAWIYDRNDLHAARNLARQDGSRRPACQRPMELIDSHVHLLEPEKFSYAWCAPVPALNHAFRLADYRAAAAGPAGVRIASAVFMEADVPAAQQEAEADYFSRLAGRDRGTLPLGAVIAGAWPESAEFPAQLERYALDARIRGVRRVLHTMPDGLVQTPRFAENLRRLAQYGFTFDVCLRPHLLPAVTDLVARCPETQFVLDHCGVPDIAGGQLDPWRGLIRQLAARPNVTCKFSGLASVCDPAKPLTPQVRPYFEHCLECFSPARLMWGSDWPVCNLGFNLAAWLQTTGDLLGALSPDEQAAIGSGTARRIYRLKA